MSFRFERVSADAFDLLVILKKLNISFAKVKEEEVMYPQMLTSLIHLEEIRIENDTNIDEEEEEEEVTYPKLDLNESNLFQWQVNASLF